MRDTANILSTEGGKNAIMHLYDTLELKGLIPFVPADEVIDKIYEHLRKILMKDISLMGFDD